MERAWGHGPGFAGRMRRSGCHDPGTRRPLPLTGFAFVLGLVVGGCDPAPRSSSPEDATAAAEEGDATSLGALEQRLAEARALEDPEQRALIVEEIAQTLVRFHGDEARDLTAPPSPEAGPDADDALRDQFANALAQDDRAARHRALRDMARTLAGRGNLSTALDLMDELLRIKDAEGGGDGYVFATAFAEFAATAGGDPAQGIAWTRSLPPTLRGAAQQALTQAWAKSDPDAVDAWRISEDDPVARSVIIRAMGNELRSADDTTASAWARRLAADPQDGPRHSDVVVEHWTRTDMEEAIAWIGTIENPDFQSRAMRTLAASIAARDPNEAGQWLERFPDGEWKTLALTDTANRWGTTDPAAAATWISGLHRPDVARATAASIARTWAATDRAAAVSWVRELTIDEPSRSYVLKLLGEE